LASEHIEIDDAIEIAEKIEKRRARARPLFLIQRT
jgi:hypothetical protein